MIQNATNGHINDVLHHMSQAEHGAHYMIIYQDLDMLRELYSNYVHKQIKENNEIVLINPFYETTDSVMEVLSEKYNDGMNSISRYQKEKSLLIADALESYFSEQNTDDYSFKMSLSDHAKKTGKNGLSILGDMGAFTHKLKYEELVNYELSLPTKYDDGNGIALKGFCFYHQKDFDMLSDEQKQKLFEHHGKALKITQIY